MVRHRPRHQPDDLEALNPDSTREAENRRGLPMGELAPPSATRRAHLVHRGRRDLDIQSAIFAGDTASLASHGAAGICTVGPDSLARMRYEPCAGRCVIWGAHLAGGGLDPLPWLLPQSLGAALVTSA